jgi:hypothetical protein
MPPRPAPSPTELRTGKRTAWVLRFAWIALGIVGSVASARALDNRTEQVRWVVTIWVSAIWFGALVAMLVPSVTTLTIVRLTVPAAPITAMAGLIAGASTVPGVVTVVLGVVAAVVALSADIGQHFIQSSAYGHEQRFPLRPPGALLLGPIQLLWAIAVGPLLIGPPLVAAEQTVVGGLVAIVGIGMLWVLAPRFHELGRRWLVFVPAGLVVHDHVPLAETVMVSAGDVEIINLAPTDTTAVDLTANALGPAVEISIRQPTAVARKGTTRDASSETVAADRLLVSPSRPGRVVAAARERGW